MKNLIVSILSLLFISPFLTAQNLNDAIRYSMLDIGGTARTVGVGGAMGALGADFSVLSTNPAGAAVYRRSEFTFTPALEQTTSEARLESEGNFAYERDKNNFSFHNIGIVFSTRPLDSKWRTSVFGIGMNRLANFHQSLYYQGSSYGSITDRWWELADGLTSDQLDAFEAGLAYDAGALYEDANDPTFYYTDFLDDNLNIGNVLVDKSQLIRRTGSINELVFSFAGNYDERLMVGATLGVPIVSYEETKTYNETDDGDKILYFDELEFTERLTTTGAGINLKVGVIYRLNQMVRLGVAVHTPTGYGLDDSFSTSLKYQYTDANGTQRFEQDSPDGSFDYKFRTPWRFIGSAGFLFTKNGFLGAEVEYIDYSSGRFNFKNTNNADDIAYEQDLNNEILDRLYRGVNFRFGGEYVMDAFRFRAGYQITASPYLNDDSTNGAWSLGAGYRGENIFLDFAFKRFDEESVYTPYYLSDTNLEQSVGLNVVRNRFMLTVGFKI